MLQSAACTHIAPPFFCRIALVDDVAQDLRAALLREKTLEKTGTIASTSTSATAGDDDLLDEELQ